GGEIEPEEALPAEPAHAEREGGEVAHAVDEAEAQDEGGAVALEPSEGTIDPAAPAREALQEARPGTPPDPEIELIAAEATEPGAEEQEEGVDQALRREEGGAQHERLALEERPGERNKIEQGAVFGDPVFKTHRRAKPLLAFFSLSWT